MSVDSYELYIPLTRLRCCCAQIAALARPAVAQAGKLPRFVGSPLGLATMQQPSCGAATRLAPSYGKVLRMPVEVHYEAQGDHVAVRVAGSPTLGEFLGVLRQLGADSAAWPQKLVLIDLRAVLPRYSFTEQFTIGEEVGRALQHLQRFASVVPPDRITHVSEKAARHRGVDVRVFIDEGQAVAWLRQPPEREQRP
jgi:hypothetical protein